MEQYEELRRIGKGAEGSVFLCRLKETGEERVIKKVFLRSGRSTAIREASILSQLHHPFVVRYYDSFLDARAEHLCLVMEHCSGGSLDARIRQLKEAGETLSERQVMDWFVQLTLALQYVHSKKILHRDLKTPNVFLTANNMIKVGDFGIAAQLENTLDLKNTCVGSPYYMSPEVVQDIPYNFKSDVWSLGCVLYEMCSLEPAFGGRNLMAIVHKIVGGQFQPVPSTYSEELRGLVDQLLQVQSAQRPSIRDLITQDAYFKSCLKTFEANLSQTVDAGQAAHSARSSTPSPSLSDTGKVRLLPPRRRARAYRQLGARQRKQRQPAARRREPGLPPVPTASASRRPATTSDSLRRPGSAALRPQTSRRKPRPATQAAGRPPGRLGEQAQAQGRPKPRSSSFSGTATAASGKPPTSPTRKQRCSLLSTAPGAAPSSAASAAKPTKPRKKSTRKTTSSKGKGKQRRRKRQAPVKRCAAPTPSGSGRVDITPSSSPDLPSGRERQQDGAGAIDAPIPSPPPQGSGDKRDAGGETETLPAPKGNGAGPALLPVITTETIVAQEDSSGLGSDAGGSPTLGLPHICSGGGGQRGPSPLSDSGHSHVEVEYESDFEPFSPSSDADSDPSDDGEQSGSSHASGVSDAVSEDALSDYSSRGSSGEEVEDAYDLIEAMSLARVALSSRAEDYVESLDEDLDLGDAHSAGTADSINGTPEVEPPRHPLRRHCVDVLGEGLYQRVHDFFAGRLAGPPRDAVPEAEGLHALVDGAEQLKACHLVRELVAIEAGTLSRD